MSLCNRPASRIHPRRIGGFGFYPISAALLLGFALNPAVAPATFLTLVAITWIMVLVHELGHAVIARRSGFTVLRMTVYPVHGMTRIRRPAGRPASSGWLATIIAGPVAGAVVASIGLAVLAALRAVASVPTILDGPFLGWILIGGIADQIVNLLPLHNAFDGARARKEFARIRALRGADARVRQIRHAAAISIHVPPSEDEAAPLTRRAA